MNVIKYPRSIEHKEYQHNGQILILNTSEMANGSYETMAMTKDGDELTCLINYSEAGARCDFKHLLSKYPEDVQTTAIKPLSGKYAKLRDDITKAIEIGKSAAEFVDDSGTCNIDAPALYLPRWNKALVERAIKEAGCRHFIWSSCSEKCFVIRGGFSGQAYQNEVAAEAATKALKNMGYDAFCYQQID